MAYLPISNTAPQYAASGSTLASGYYLKAYQAGTTTPLSMATDKTAGTTLAKCKLNSQGYPISIPTDDTSVFIPHFNEDYKLALYPTEADADANTFGNADWVIDNLGTSTNTAQYAATVAIMKTLGLAVGDVIETGGYTSAGDGGGARYVIVAGGTGTDDGGLYHDLDNGNQAKQIIEDRLSLASYGALGSGDDTTKIQAALDSGITDIQGVASTSHALSSTLTVPANVNLFMDGVTFTAATHFKMFDFVSGGSIRGATLTGAGDTSFTSGSWGIGCSGTNNSPSAPTYTTAPEILDCDISSFGEYGIKFEYAQNGRIEGCRISDVGYAGIGGISCNDIIVTNNTIKDIDQGSSTDGYGIFIDRADGTSETSEPRSYRCIISNNIIKNVQVGGNGQGLDTHAGVDFIFDSNVVKDCDSGIRLATSQISGTEQLGCIRCVVSNNVVQRSLSSSVNIGIGVSGALSGSTVNQYAVDNVVVGNTVTGYGLAGETTSGGIKIQATKGTIIANNVVKNSNANGLYLNLENKNVQITGNTFIDPWDNSVTAPSCIEVDGNNNTGRIANNTFIYDDNSLGTYVAVRAISISGSLTGLDLDLKDSTFIGIDASHLNNSISTTTGVNQTSLYCASGTSTVTITSGAGVDYLDVSFDKRFPYIPSISLTPRHTFTVGGKNPILGVTNSPAVSQTGFRIAVEPADNTTWGGNATLNVFWKAE